MNPREACTPDGFRDRSIRPLWHPSVAEGYRAVKPTRQVVDDSLNCARYRGAVLSTDNQMSSRNTIGTNSIALIGSSCGSLLAYGFTPFESVRLVLLAGFVSVLGGMIWLSVVKDAVVNLTEVIGVGMALMAGLLAIGNLLTRQLNSWLVLVLLAIPTVAWMRRSVKSSIDRLHAGRNTDMVLLGATPLVALLPFNLKTLPAALIILAVIGIRPTRQWINSLNPGLLVTISAIPGVLTYLAYQISGLNLPWQDAVELDVVFDESFTIGVTNLGLSSSITMLDEPVSGHFVTHSFFGLVSEIVAFPPFGILGIGGYAIAVIGVALIAFSLATRISGRTSIGWIAVSVIFLQSTVSFPVIFVPALRATNALALLWFVFAIAISYRLNERTLRFPYLWMGIAISLALLGKFQWGFVLVGYLVALPLVALLSGQKPRRELVVAGLALMLGVFWYFLFLKGPDGEDVSLGISRGILAAGIMILLARLVIFAGLLSGERAIERRAASLAGLGATAIWVLIGGVFRTDYFNQALAILTAVVVVPSTLRQHDGELRSTRKRRWLLVFAFAIGALVSLAQLIIVGFWRYRPGISMGPLNRPGAIDLILAVGFMIVLMATILSMRHGSWSSRLAGAVVVSLLMSTGIFAAQIMKPVVHGVLFGADEFSSSFISQDQLDVGTWIRSNTAADTIVATSSLCPVEMTIGNPVPDNDPENRCESRNRNAWISALGHRQMLIESPYFGPLGFAIVKNPEHVDRYSASVGFGATGDPEFRESLIADGASWFVVDLELSDVDDWSERNDVVYSNDSYAIVDLAGQN